MEKVLGEIKPNSWPITVVNYYIQIFMYFQLLSGHSHIQIISFLSVYINHLFSCSTLTNAVKVSGTAEVIFLPQISFKKNGNVMFSFLTPPFTQSDYVIISPPAFCLMKLLLNCLQLWLQKRMVFGLVLLMSQWNWNVSKV